MAKGFFLQLSHRAQAALLGAGPGEYELEYGFDLFRFQPLQHSLLADDLHEFGLAGRRPHRHYSVCLHTPDL